MYAKDTRFVYELIQNAEDNEYHRATTQSEAPWLKFSLQPDRIVIDSNEDGFSRANIKAICSCGESTKSFIQGYIGEKGIGFKSVFKVAHKVHVQSGVHSFAFEYDPDGNDNGLGMVTPMNETRHEIPPGVGTRIILHLRNDCARATLAKEFDSLPDTLLLFLKKLKRISIQVSLPSYPAVHHSFSLSTTLFTQRTILQKTCHLTNIITTQRFWIARKVATDMPADRARKGVSEAEVVLAFPLDENEGPLIAEQQTFAFLPLRKAGYKVSPYFPR